MRAYANSAKVIAAGSLSMRRAANVSRKVLSQPLVGHCEVGVSPPLISITTNSEFGVMLVVIEQTAETRGIHKGGVCGKGHTGIGRIGHAGHLRME